MRWVRGVFLAACLLGLLLPIGLLANDGSPYGIHAHIPGVPLLDLVQQAGIGWIRADFNWYMIEPAKDVYEWDLFDELVSNAQARGIRVLATLAFTPAWAGRGGGMADPPNDPEEWFDFVFSVVARYRGSIQHWEMWNEPNLDKFWAGTRGQYREWILTGGSMAARAADPSCQVVAPGLAHVAATQWWEWLAEILGGDGKEYVDVVSHHCYADCAEDVIRLLETGDDTNPSVRSVLQEAGAGDKPFWLTETGWHTARRSVEEGWSGPPLPGHHYRLGDVSEEVQAYHYRRLCWELIQRDWFDRVFFYELRDDAAPQVDKWGILRSDNTPKQAYHAYRDFIANPREPEFPAGGCTCRTVQEDGVEDAGVLQQLIPEFLLWGLVASFVQRERRLRRGIPAAGCTASPRSRTGTPRAHKA